ncbi:hypothetical protein MNBD_GAMMA22-3112 [hydrothermal vent metagenome]|uniref:Cds6 C-terminal domain-containing protein n=1 Tax=hydrothermal vent metagenome TaxID=652676 RepID=A0A3B1A6A4_9ZZZZ
MLKIRLFILLSILLISLNTNAQIPSVEKFSTVQQLIVQQKYEQALAKIDQKLISYVNNQDLLHLRAHTELKLNKTKQAITSYNLIIKLYPSSPMAYNNIAGIYAKQGKYELAKKLLEKGINTNKSYALLHNNIKSINFEMARESYVKALRLGVTKKNVELNVANLETKSNSTKKIQLAKLNSKPVIQAKLNTPITKKTRAIKSSSEPVLSVKDEVITALKGWAAAWSAQDVNLYLSFYNKRFLPESGASKRIWESQRQVRLLKPRWIEVRLSDFSFELYANDKAEVKVTQVYRSNSFKDKSKKKFLLKRSDDGWQILNEINYQD